MPQSTKNEGRQYIKKIFDDHGAQEERSKIKGSFEALIAHQETQQRVTDPVSV